MLAPFSPAALADSCHQSPDVPTTLGATTFVSSQVIRDGSGSQMLELSLPPGVAVDALRRRGDAGREPVPVTGRAV